MSVITPEGEEYVGPMAEVWMEPESDPWALFDVLVAVLVVIAAIVAFIWYINRGKLNR
jgi:flagellar biogenesis protein FliO